MRVEIALQVNINDLVPKFRIGDKERLGLVPASIVDQCPNWPQIFFHRFYRSVDGVIITDIDLIGFHRRIARQSRCFFTSFCAEVKYGNLAALFRQAQNERAANTLAAAGYNRDLILQSTHFRSPVFQSSL